ncbi:MAG: hypothetical protein JF610_14255, partial [Acidobacteria bacterium]|nr:hypothetical protein [Acidobacteriota bacterium]
LEALAADFTGLRDVAAEATRARDLARQPDVKKALAHERADDDAEARRLDQIFELEAGLRDPQRHNESLGRLREELTRYAKVAAADTESPERSQARRLLRTISGAAAERVDDSDYRALLDHVAPRGRQP